MGPCLWQRSRWPIGRAGCGCGFGRHNDVALPATWICQPVCFDGQNYCPPQQCPMVKNSHFIIALNNLYHTLNDTLLLQPFADTVDADRHLQWGQSVARMYACMENAISVLSDMQANKSYLYHRGIAADLGMPGLADGQEIASIWEREILDRIHPDDLLVKHSLELQFFHLMKKLPVGERTDYQLLCRLRMQDRDGQYTAIRHRMFYISGADDGSIRLALCLYTLYMEANQLEPAEGMIVNTRRGRIVETGKEEVASLLSLREKEVLSLIRDGCRSKEIAVQLSISQHTVHRHRQNIFEKLQVSNSLEACKLAERMGLI